MNRFEMGPAAYLAEQLRRECGRDPRVHELGLRVTVLLGERRIVLGGAVATEARRAWVEILARELLPDYEIRNEVDVHRMDAPRREQIA